MLCGVDAPEYGKEIAVERRRIGHARIAERSGKHGTKRGNENQSSGDRSPVRPKDALDEKADHERRILRFLPGNHGKNARLHREIERGYAKNGKENRARNIALGIFHFTAEIADDVI